MNVFVVSHEDKTFEINRKILRPYLLNRSPLRSHFVLFFYLLLLAAHYDPRPMPLLPTRHNYMFHSFFLCCFPDANYEFLPHVLCSFHLCSPQNLCSWHFAIKVIKNSVKDEGLFSGVLCTSTLQDFILHAWLIWFMLLTDCNELYLKSLLFWNP